MPGGSTRPTRQRRDRLGCRSSESDRKGRVRCKRLTRRNRHKTGIRRLTRNHPGRLQGSTKRDVRWLHGGQMPVSGQSILRDAQQNPGTRLYDGQGGTDLGCCSWHRWSFPFRCRRSSRRNRCPSEILVSRQVSKWHDGETRLALASPPTSELTLLPGSRSIAGRWNPGR